MQVRFDSLNRFETPKMFLCNPGSVYRSDKTLSDVIGILHNTSDEEIIFNFNATSELNFRVQKVQLDDPDENVQFLKTFASLQNRRMIFVDDIGFFIITEVIDGISENTVFKDITASSCESEIEYKNIPYIEDGTYQFMPLLSSLTDLLPLWTIGHVDSQVASKYRTFEGISEDKNILGFLMEDMQDAYECIFIFDNIRREINVYDQNNFVVQTPIHLTKDDLINTIEVVENSDDLYTAINVLGSDNLNITAINPLGTNVIYNFDYYLDWMSADLSAKVRNWQQLIKDKSGEYYDLNLAYYQILTEQNKEKFEMEKLQTRITMYTRCKENMVASSNTSIVYSYNEIIINEGGTPISVYPEISQTIDGIRELISQTELDYADAKNRYNSYSAQLLALEVKINSIRNQVAIEKYFSQSEYAELYNYIFEGSYLDEYITVTESMSFEQRFQQMKTLYDRAKTQLEKVSKPTQKFSVGLENFIFIQDFKEWSSKLETGCLLNIELSDNDIAALFLATIVVNYDDKSLDFTFGNRFNKYDPKSLFKDALGNIKKSSNSINYIKDIIYPIKDGKFDEVAEAIKNSRNLTKNAVLSAKNEQVLIDEHGYTGRSIDNDGSINPKQIKITGKNIVFTKDAWDTCDVAIGEIILEDDTTVYGVNAETIIGNLIFGNQLQIKNNAGTMMFNENGFTVTSYDKNTTVSIDPSNSSTFKISNKAQGDLLYVDNDGTLNVVGNITAKSLTLGSGKQFTGSYNDLTDQPTIPDSFELPGNIVTTDDISITTEGNIKYINVGNGTKYEVMNNDDYILLGVNYSEDEDTSVNDAYINQNKYFKISKDGLLEANNAVIYGQIFALNGGKIGNWEIENYALQSTKDTKLRFDAGDVRQLLKCAAGDIELSDYQKQVYDLNKDGQISALDATKMLQFIFYPDENDDVYYRGDTTVTINPEDLDKLINIEYTKNASEQASTYFGATEINIPRVRTNTIMLNGNLLQSPTILYANKSGTASDVRLSESVETYDWVYMIFGVSGDTADINTSLLVFLPQGKTISATNAMILNSIDSTDTSFKINDFRWSFDGDVLSKEDDDGISYTDGTYTRTFSELVLKYVIGFQGACWDKRTYLM